MLVTLSYERSLTLNIDAEVDWVVSSGREFGKAVFTIPASSAAWDEEIIDERGGFLVNISTQHGVWSGIAVQLEDVDAGFRVTAWDFRVFTENRPVSNHRSFHGVTPGIIAQRAVQDALIGLGGLPFTIGSILEAPPVIATYEFKGQPLINVLTDLAERSGHHWMIDHKGVFHWVSQIGMAKDFVLVDDGLFRDKLRRRSLREEYSESVEVESSGRSFSVFNPSVPITWPSQETRSIG